MLALAFERHVNGDIAPEQIATKPTIPVEEKVLTPMEYADLYATEYKIDPVVFKKVIMCESGGSPNPRGYNDGGAAYGIMQFHKPTFTRYSEKIGEGMDYHSYRDQLKVAAYMFSIGEQRQWTCYKKVTGR